MKGLKGIRYLFFMGLGVASGFANGLFLVMYYLGVRILIYYPTEPLTQVTPGYFALGLAVSILTIYMSFATLKSCNVCNTGVSKPISHNRQFTKLLN